MKTSSRMIERWMLGLLVDKLVGEAMDDAGPVANCSCHSQIKALTKEIVLNTLDRLVVERDLRWRWYVATGDAILSACLRKAVL